MAHERSAEAEKHCELRTAAINKGYALTGEISGAAEQLKKHDVQLNEIGNVLTNRQNVLKIKQDLLTKATAEIDVKQQHKQTLSVHRTMFDKFDLIKDKLSMLYTETQRNVDNHKKQNNLQRDRENLRIQSEKAEQEQHQTQAKLNALKSDLLIHKQTNQAWIRPNCNARRPTTVTDWRHCKGRTRYGATFRRVTNALPKKERRKNANKRSWRRSRAW